MFKQFNSDNSYSIYQIKSGNEFRDIRFTPYEQLQHLDKTVNSANYELIYTAPLTNDMSLDKLFEKLNTNLPADFKGHSLSVSDVVVLKQNEQSTAHYVDSIGFVDVPEFLQSLSLNEQSAKALAAVTQNGLALKHINEQNPEICLAAVTQNGAALVYVNEQTPEICLEAVTQTGWALEYVKEQNPEICLAAVKQTGWALKYVKEQTLDICLAAITQNSAALEFVNEQTPKICLAAVTQRGWALEYVKEQNPEICLAAVARNGWALEYVNEQTPEICLAAVTQDGAALEYVKEQTPEICLAAVTQNGLALKDVNEQASKVRLETTNEPDIQERLDSLYNSFEENPKALTDFLTFKSKFYSYSLRNTLLIFSQKRDATFIGSKTKFAELGYNILPECKDKGMYAYKCVKSYFFYRDKKPINTSKATNEEKELLKSGKLKTYNKKYFEKYMVYDIAHTDCPKEDYPLLYSQGKPSLSHKKMYENFKEALKKMQINFKEENLYSIALSGSYNKSTNTIKINSMLDDTEKLNTIIHETAHALLHKTSNQPIEIKEFEAQALANLLQGELGLELEPNDIKYMCTYMDKVKQCKGFNLANSLTRITKQSDFIKKNINLEISATKAHPKEMAMTMEITNVLQ